VHGVLAQREAVQERGLDLRAVEAHVVEAEVVGDDENDVGRRCHRGYGGQGQQEQEENDHGCTMRG